MRGFLVSFLFLFSTSLYANTWSLSNDNSNAFVTTSTVLAMTDGQSIIVGDLKSNKLRCSSTELVLKVEGNLVRFVQGWNDYGFCALSPKSAKGNDYLISMLKKKHRLLVGSLNVPAGGFTKALGSIGRSVEIL